MRNCSWQSAENSGVELSARSSANKANPQP
jgi:hypothetical protein